MIKEIKERLLANPDYIISVLEYYEFSHIHKIRNEIRCGVSDDNNHNSVRIKLKNNEWLYVTDYGRNLHGDLISYIISLRGEDFKSVISVIKNILGLDSFYSLQKESVFGGFYDRIRNKEQAEEIKIYDNAILEQYEDAPNLRFMQDNIDINTQKHFGIRYDIISQRIIIPIYDQFGSLMGIKGRANWNVLDEEAKYLYLVPCRMSLTLYGYSENYNELIKGEIFIFESEKSVMQSYAFGVKNCVALGSNSLSRTQAKLIAELKPRKVVFMLDQGLDLNITEKNARQLSYYTKMIDVKMYYWNYNKSTIDKKSSPTDFGSDVFQDILENDIEEVNIDV